MQLLALGPRRLPKVARGLAAAAKYYHIWRNRDKYVGRDSFVGSFCLCAVYRPTSYRLGCSLAFAVARSRVCVRFTGRLQIRLGCFCDWPSVAVLSCGFWVLINEGIRIMDVGEALVVDKLMACYC